MKPSKYQDFIKLVDQTYQQFNWRYGQTVMNVLHSLYPEKYKDLVATDNDCYYDENKVNQTLKIIEEWTHNASM